MDKPNTIPWPPILYGVAIIIAWLLQRSFPLPWISGYIADLGFMLGWILVAVAIFIDLRTFLELRKHKTTVLPNAAASQLVTSGPFSFSRNPIYLSNTMLTFGLGLAFSNLWLFAAGLIAAILTNHLAIKREEKHLAAKFGSSWRAYSKNVKRWI